MAWRTLAAFLLMVAGSAFSQDSPGLNAPSITMAPPPTAQVTTAKSGKVDLTFRISKGFHINSNKPHSELLIPTVLKLEPPTDVSVGKITYPAGEDISLDFDPENKLSVYTGDFTISALIGAMRSTPPGTYKVRGTLAYQACDNRACFPPKKLPVEFNVHVTKAPATKQRRRPGQSPHAHT